MNKAELIEQVAESAGLSKADATRALDAILDGISGALESGDQVALVGFGTFSVKVRSARTGINPKTREPLEIPEKKVANFKASKALAEKVNS